MRGVPKGLTELATRLAGMMDDASHERWTLTEKKDCINLAILASWPRWFEIQIDATATYTKTIFQYTLPSGMEDLIAVYLEPVTAGEAWKLIRGWHTDGDYLFFHEAQDAFTSKSMRLVGIRVAWEVLEVSGADGVITGVTTPTDTFTSATATFKTDNVRAGDKLTLTSGTGLTDDIGYYWIKSVDSENQLTIYGAFTEDATVIVFEVDEFTTVPEMYLLNKAAAECFQLAGHKGAGQDIAEDMQWAEFHSQMAEYYLEKQERKFPSRRG